MKKAFLVISALLVLAGCGPEDPGPSDGGGSQQGGEVVSFQISCVTGDVSEVTHVSARLNGWVTVEGAPEEVPAMGVFYYSLTEGTAEQMMATGIRVPAGQMPSAGGGFRVDLTELEPLVRYYYLAVASSGNHVAYGSVRSFLTKETPKELSVTGEALSITEFSATLSGYAYPREDTGAFTYGLEWSRTEDMAEAVSLRCSDKLNDFNAYYASLDGLYPDFDYYFRSFVKVGDEYTYGEVVKFHTSPLTTEEVMITTDDVSEITEFKALLSGSLRMNTKAQMGSKVWFLFGKDAEYEVIPETLDTKMLPDSTFSFRKEGLEHGQMGHTYYCRAVVAVNYGGYFEKVFEGETKSFTTLPIDSEVTTLEAKEVTEFKATLQGQISPNVEEPMEMKVWFLYGTKDEQGKVVYSHKTDDKITIMEGGTFSVGINNLEYGQTYYFKACAKVHTEQFEGEVQSFETVDISATVNTLPATGIGEYEATLNATLTDVSNPTFQKDVWFYYVKGDTAPENWEADGIRLNSSLKADGKYDATVGGLDYGQKYTYVACARVRDKEFYGAVGSFETTDIPVTLTTGEATAVTETGATLNGTLVDGSSDKFDKALYFCYSESYGAETTAAKIKSEWMKVKASYHDDGTIQAPVTGLEPGKTYYYVAYLRVYKEDFFGEIEHFETVDITATVTATGATDIGYHKVTLRGELTGVSNPDLEAKFSFIWTDNISVESPVWHNVSATVDGNSFSAVLGELDSDKTYYYQAKATIRDRVFSSDVVAFSTKTPPAGSVDMGGGVCWAVANYGAANDYEAGNFYDWTEAKAVAAAEGLALPTYAQFDELRRNCTWTYTNEYYGIYGYRVTAKNGNSIFLPATGHYHIGTFNGADSGLWSSESRKTSPSYAYYLRFSSGTVEIASGSTTPINSPDYPDPIPSYKFPIRLVYE